MARITVEDYMDKVENRFGLVHLAAKRSKHLVKGGRPTVRSSNREVVTSLREIAAGEAACIRRPLRPQKRHPGAGSLLCPSPPNAVRNCRNLPK
jgi:DNA-directed RNA polymerase subunit omega